MIRWTALAAVAALALAGCGSSDDSSSSSGSSGGSGDASSADVSLRSTEIGDVLVDSSGRTVYLFEKDSGPKSSCSGACAKAWPPVVVNSKPSGGKGVDAGKLSTSKRSDGTTQVTYAGHPLYTYEDDTKPGQTEGQDKDEFGAQWYAMAASGDKASGKSGSDDSGGGSPSRSGY